MVIVKYINNYMINANDFVKFAKKILKNQQLVVAIQREPYIHIKTSEGIVMQKAAGGAHLLLDGILKQIGGLMVAVASGNADQDVVDNKGRFYVKTNNDKSYTLKRIFLKKKELDGFYYGFANQTLWPLSHVVFVKPVFNPNWWLEYEKVNQKFAEAILEEIEEKNAFIWVNDYHLALLPQLLKNQKTNLKIGFFWHIPWPTYEIFRICPWRKQILEGLLGSDFIGFHRGYHVENFIQCVRRELEVLIDSEPRSIQYKDHQTKMNNIPAGIDYFEIIEKLENSPKITNGLIKKDFGFNYKFLAIGVDRIDYTKGLLERLKIIDRFLEKYPQYQEKFVYLSIGAPSRIHIPAYKKLNQEIFDLIEKINWKYSTSKWQPIVFINKVIPREKIFKYYHLADICLVTSLDDGMNLVAKEFIICNNPEKGMLLLSKFTGAAKDLKSAYLINPYDIEGSADALFEALNISPQEKLKRNKEMKNILKEENIYRWGIQFIQNTIS